MGNYLIQSIIFQLAFLLLFDISLRKETFHTYNRIYLLSTSCLSLVLPLIKFEGLLNMARLNSVISLPEIILNTSPKNEVVYIHRIPSVIIGKDSWWSWEKIIYLGSAIAFLLFIIKIVYLVRLYVQSDRKKYGNIQIIQLKERKRAFSVFNYVFLGTNISAKEKETILAHEKVHVKQLHSLDIIYFELLKVIFWFNPLIYIYQNRVKSVHEFIADKQSYGNSKEYYEHILNHMFKTENISFINTFYKNSLIKKRIVMLNKTHSRKSKLFKYLTTLPLVFLMLFYVSCEQDSISGNNESDNLTEQIHQMTMSIESVDELSDSEKASLQELASKISILTKATGVNDNDLNQTIDELIIEEIEVPFGVIEHVPVYNGCDPLLSRQELKECTSQKISLFVNENFNTDLASQYNLEGRQRINVIFKINKDGDPVNIRARAPHPSLEQEAIRVISLLPKFKPGMQKGHLVTVPYSLPIIFEVNK